MDGKTPTVVTEIVANLAVIVVDTTMTAVTSSFSVVTSMVSTLSLVTVIVITGVKIVREVSGVVYRAAGLIGGAVSTLLG